ncbi:MAG: transcriptional regulator [Candidatus Eremiobacteraeota bacterium]|nr:transcriptional regulator [Candidatus Eremiobacteraeota bacterium]
MQRALGSGYDTFVITARRRPRVAVVGPSEMAADVRDALHDELDVIRRVWLPGAEAPRTLDEGVDALLLVVHEHELARCVPAARKNTRLPLIVMTLDTTANARARALDLGADDAISAAWDDAELRARIRALLRRTPGSLPAVVQVEDLEIDLGARSVRRGGDLVRISPAEFSVLGSLARNPGNVVRREDLAREVWGDAQAVADGRLHTTVSTLRSKLDRSPFVPLIRTIHRVGYALRR